MSKKGTGVSAWKLLISSEVDLRNLEKLDRPLKHAKRRIDNFSSSLKQFSRIGAEVFGQGLSIASQNLVNFGKDALIVGANFEQAITTVGAIKGVTGENLKALEDQARMLGQTTLYTATQAAQGMEELARAGLDVQNIIGVTGDALNFAGANATTLNNSTRLLAATMAQFNLTSKDAARITDIFTVAMQNSLFDMESLTVAMRYGGSVGAAMGADLEETVAVMSAFRDLGLEGSMVGTRFRQAILSLAKPTKAAKETLDLYNIGLDEINPNIVGLTQALRRLGQAGLGVPEIASIVSKRAAGSVFKISQELANADQILNEARTAEQRKRQEEIDKFTIEREKEKLKEKQVLQMKALEQELLIRERGALIVKNQTVNDLEELEKEKAKLTKYWKKIIATNEARNNTLRARENKKLRNEELKSNQKEIDTKSKFLQDIERKHEQLKNTRIKHEEELASVEEKVLGKRLKGLHKIEAMLVKFDKQAGVTEKTYSKMIDTTVGQTKILNSALQELKISIFDVLIMDKFNESLEDTGVSIFTVKDAIKSLITLVEDLTSIIQMDAVSAAFTFDSEFRQAFENLNTNSEKFAATIIASLSTLAKFGAWLASWIPTLISVGKVLTSVFAAVSLVSFVSLSIKALGLLTATIQKTSVFVFGQTALISRGLDVLTVKLTAIRTLLGGPVGIVVAIAAVAAGFVYLSGVISDVNEQAELTAKKLRKVKEVQIGFEEEIRAINVANQKDNIQAIRVELAQRGQLSEAINKELVRLKALTDAQKEQGIKSGTLQRMEVFNQQVLLSAKGVQLLAKAFGEKDFKVADDLLETQYQNLKQLKERQEDLNKQFNVAKNIRLEAQKIAKDDISNDYQKVASLQELREQFIEIGLITKDEEGFRTVAEGVNQIETAFQVLETRFVNVRTMFKGMKKDFEDTSKEQKFADLVKRIAEEEEKAAEASDKWRKAYEKAKEARIKFEKELQKELEDSRANESEQLALQVKRRIEQAKEIYAAEINLIKKNSKEVVRLQKRLQDSLSKMKEVYLNGILKENQESLDEITKQNDSAFENERQRAKREFDENIKAQEQTYKKQLKGLEEYIGKEEDIVKAYRERLDLFNENRRKGKIKSDEKVNDLRIQATEEYLKKITEQRLKTNKETQAIEKQQTEKLKQITLAHQIELTKIRQAELDDIAQKKKSIEQAFESEFEIMKKAHDEAIKLMEAQDARQTDINERKKVQAMEELSLNEAVQEEILKKYGESTAAIQLLEQQLVKSTKKAEQEKLEAGIERLKAIAELDNWKESQLQRVRGAAKEVELRKAIELQYHLELRKINKETNEEILVSQTKLFKAIKFFSDSIISSYGLIGKSLDKISDTSFQSLIDKSKEFLKDTKLVLEIIKEVSKENMFGGIRTAVKEFKNQPKTETVRDSTFGDIEVQKRKDFTPFTNLFKEYIKKGKEFVVGIGSSITTVLTKVGELKLEDVIKFFEKLGSIGRVVFNGLKSSIQGLISIGKKLGASMASAFSFVTGGMDLSPMQMLSQGAKSILDTQKEAAKTLKDLDDQLKRGDISQSEYDEARRLGVGDSDPKSAATSFIKEIIDNAVNMVKAIAEGAPFIFQAFVRQFPVLINALVKNIPIIIDALVQFLPKFVTVLMNAISTLLPVVINKLIEELPNIVSAFVEFIAVQLPALFDRITPLIVQLVKVIANQIPRLVSAFMAMLPSLLNMVVKITVAIINELPAIFNAIIKELPTLITALIGGLTQVLAAVLQAIPVITRSLIKELPNILMSLMDGLVTIVLMLAEQMPVLIAKIISQIPLLITSLLMAVDRMVFALIGAIPDILFAFIKQLPKIISALIVMLPKLVAGIIVMLPKIASTLVSEIFKFIFSADGLATVGLELIKAIGEGFKKGVVNFINGIGQFFRDVWKEMKSFGDAETKTFGDTPHAIKAGSTGLAARFAAGDFVIAAQQPQELLRQAVQLVGKNVSSALDVAQRPPPPTGTSGSSSSPIDIAIIAEGRLLDAVQVRAMDRGHAPKMERKLRRASGVNVGFNRGKFNRFAG